MAAGTSLYFQPLSKVELIITDSSFFQLNSNKMRVLILLMVLASGRGMPLGNNGASFQRKAGQWSRDNDLSAKNKAPLALKHFLNERKAPLTFEHLSAENEAPLAFNHFSDENEAPNSFNHFYDENKVPVTFKRLFPENEALLARPLDENEAPFISKHLSDEDEAPPRSFYSELISETFHLEKYKKTIINSEADLRGYMFRYNIPDFAVDGRDFDDHDDDDHDDDNDYDYDDNCDNYDNYNDVNFGDYDSYAENWADFGDNDDNDLDVDDATNAILMTLY